MPTKKRWALNVLMKCNLRNLSYKCSEDLSSFKIRQKFFDYFLSDHSHNFVRSSPVVPLCDPTVAFVNAGMNQFKGIFLGTQNSQFTKVANSQKCVRVGGKHNDLSVVGTDGYHHTFFEMLGNWSFGSYFKAEACSLAWELLTKGYEIPPSRLYVTYFKGNPNYGLEEDIETKQIWEELGVSPDRILPFGSKDNFWEMGLSGPCGPCTEIHYDHRGDFNRKDFVNKGLYDLIEVWNLVFISYNRCQNGTLEPLPVKHVDTGMGLERLVAILQGKHSNYDTDLFTDLFTAINKISSNNVPKYGGKYGENDWNNVDTNYRTLADHCRMVTVCLGDGVIPEENQKLRRIIRKCFLIGETVFKQKTGLVKELSNYVVASLGLVYPELEKNLAQIHQILDYEEYVFRSNRDSSTAEWRKLVAENMKLEHLDIVESPNVVLAYKELKNYGAQTLSPEFSFKLYDTFGLDEDTIEKLSTAVDKQFNPTHLEQELIQAKHRSKAAIVKNTTNLIGELNLQKIVPTDDSFKYNYSKDNNNYTFNFVNARVEAIIFKDKIVQEIDNGVQCSLLLNKTNLYTNAGGQSSDKGIIEFPTGIFEVVGLEKLNDYILHNGVFHINQKFPVRTNGRILVNEAHRLGNMRNHTSIHLLNAAIRKCRGASAQKGSKVTHSCAILDIAVFGKKIGIKDVISLENIINNIINEKLDINVLTVNSNELLGFDNITTIPGEIYPENNIRVVEVQSPNGVFSREPCCGTHVHNTGDLKDFTVIGLKSLGRSTSSLTTVTAERAQLARENAYKIGTKIDQLEKTVNSNFSELHDLEVAIQDLHKQLNFELDGNDILPIISKNKYLKQLDKIGVEIKLKQRRTVKNFIEIEMQNVLESNLKMTKTNKPYVIHYLRSSMIMNSVPLQRATKLSPNIPILVISYSDNMVKARCCVPQEFASDEFTAEEWLNKSIVGVFKSRVLQQKGQNANLVCNMKPKHIHLHEWDILLTEGIAKAKEYVEKYL